MNKLQQIFEKIEGREWDWFGNNNESWKVVSYHCGQGRLYFNADEIKGEFGRGGAYSLADLLANKSWSKAVWGEAEECPDEDCCPTWKGRSYSAFQILQIDGPDDCLNYILKTINPH